VHEFCQELPQHIDVLRYYLTKTMPEQKDSEFTWKGFQDANNNELVNNLANFINRVLVLTNKYYDGVIPNFDEDMPLTDPINMDEFTYLDSELLRVYDYLFDIHQKIISFDFRGGLKTVMELSAYGNQLLQNNEPWKIIKTDPDTVKLIMFLSNQVVAALSVAMHPFMPDAANRLRNMLGLPSIEENGELLDMMNVLAEGEFLLNPEHKLGTSSHLFTKIPDEVISAQQEKLVAGTASSNNITFEPVKENIAFDDFAKIDLRTGTIIAAEKVRKAKKLLKLTIDLGFEERTIVSGISEHFEADEIIGKKVSVVVNLAPKTLRGVESNGMILMSENNEGVLNFVSPPKGSENGLMIR
jgi:methionyl-tRNA synthetase